MEIVDLDLLTAKNLNVLLLSLLNAIMVCAYQTSLIARKKTAVLLTSLTNARMVHALLTQPPVLISQKVTALLTHIYAMMVHVSLKELHVPKQTDGPLIPPVNALTEHALIQRRQLVLSQPVHRILL